MDSLDSRHDFNYILYTDGGGNDLAGGAACIIENSDGQIIQKLCTPLLGCNGNHAEVLAGAIGFSYLQNQHLTPPGIRILWFCDSAYVKHLIAGQITSPSIAASKHDSLLKDLSKNFVLTLQHPTTGKASKRALACHRAAVWMQKRGRDLISKHGNGTIRTVVSGNRQNEHCWSLIANPEELFAGISEKLE